MLYLKARLDTDTDSETLDCYTAYIDDDVDHSIDFWFPKKEQPASVDIHVEFEREND